MKNRTLTILGILALSLVVGGAVYAQERDGSLGSAVTGTGSGVCKYGFETLSNVLTPTTGTVAGSVQLTKTCAGPTEGRFTSETVVADGGYIDIQNMSATCIATAGQADPCTVGEVVYASPGLTYFDHIAGVHETHAMNMIWPTLKRGTWRFQVITSGDGDSTLQYRTFSVQTHSP